MSMEGKYSDVQNTCHGNVNLTDKSRVFFSELMLLSLFLATTEAWDLVCYLPVPKHTTEGSLVPNQFRNYLYHLRFTGGNVGRRSKVISLVLHGYLGARMYCPVEWEMTVTE